jgi:glycine betaine/proline transport system permease protein
MSVAAAVVGGSYRRSPWPLIWLGFLIAVIALWLLRDTLAPLVKYPDKWELGITKWIGAASKWLVAHFQFVTRGLAAILDVPLRAAIAILAKGVLAQNDAVLFPRLSWVGILGVVALMGWSLGGLRIGLAVLGYFAYMAFFGQWTGAMTTLASVIICVPVAVVLGTGFGVLAHRYPRVSVWIFQPILDLMQTTPVFAYLVPILVLFGSGPVPALVATVIFAAPPMVRATELALKSVAEDVKDFADMAGCTPRQKLWRVMMPTSRPLLMIGVNQVIMMTLNMVILASVIGAGGLGFDVWMALRQGDITRGAEAGIAMVFLAKALDDLAQSATRERVPEPKIGQGFVARHPVFMIGLVWLFVTTALSLYLPFFAKVPEALTFSFGGALDAAVKWVNLNFYDYISAGKTWLLLNIMNPVKVSLLTAPWLAIYGAVALLGFQLGGKRLGFLVMALVGFILLVGQWDKAMVSVYMCAIAAIVSSLIGVPIGIWASRSDFANRIATWTVDTLQTMPTLIYLIPVIMLFSIGDVTAIIAIISFAVTPAIRYTAHGLRNVSPQVIEAARAMGSTRSQILWRVQVPLALPEIMLGINQVILFSLSMLVITALVGTRDLGQEVYTALTRADAGLGIVAGLCVAFLGIVLDRIVATGAKRLRERLGSIELQPSH